MLSITDYKQKSWKETFTDNKVCFDGLMNNPTWKPVFDQNSELLAEAEEFLSHKMEEDKTFYPYPKLLFNAFNYTDLNRVKVVILGQDPYHGYDIYKKKKIPQAMGMSFSVPDGMQVPSSLDNIYRNMLKFEHLTEKPKSGNLELWASQGCLMLNTILTVDEKTPKSHQKCWTKFTDNIIRYISQNLEGVVFVLWGSPALEKLHLIDQSKHKVTISSHPSGLSCHKRLRQYQAFVDCNHFRIINQKHPIVWGL
jgi:uracil-DNA glycosylase